MEDKFSSQISKISKIYNYNGYVLNSDIIQRIDNISKSIIEYSKENNTMEVIYFTRMVGNKTNEFKDIDKLNEHLNNESNNIETISLQYNIYGKTGIEIVFNNNGEIKLSGYSNELDFQFKVDKIQREIERSKQNYSWFTQNFIFNFPKRILAILIILLSLFLFFNIGFYFFASNVGVNIDPNIIPHGNAYYQEVEQALKSSDQIKKLNVLLYAQLQGFQNVQDILINTEEKIIVILVILIIIIMVALLFKVINKLYPKSFYSFGDSIKRLDDLKRKRDIWGVSIIIGFIINLLAGLILVILTR